MTDLFDLPAQRELPDAVRDRARTRILTELRAEDRPRRLRAILPAAAAIVVFAGGVAVLKTVDNEPDGHTPPAQPTQTNVVSPDGLGAVSPEVLDHARSHQVPGDDDTRCKAQATHEPAGTPGPARWQPIVSTSVDDVDLVAYQTPAGPLFCEVTPDTVTLSDPARGHVATAKATFTTAMGSVAGVINAKYTWLYLRTAGPSRGLPGTPAVIEDGVFVAPNVLPAHPQPVMTGYVTPQPVGTGEAIAEAPGGNGGAALGTVTDRIVAPVDQSSPSGQLLLNCLAHDYTPVVVPSAWTPGVVATMDDHQTIQLGHYGDLLMACQIVDGTTDATVYDATDIGIAPPTVPENPYLASDWLYYDFRPGSGGTSGSDTATFVGVLKSDKVAKVALTLTGQPTATAIIQNGTFLVDMPVPINAIITTNVGTVTVSDAHNAVLAQLALP